MTIINYRKIYVPELEPIVEDNWNNEDVLKEINNVLKNRQSPRAQKLIKKITVRLLEIKSTQNTIKQADSTKSNRMKKTIFKGFAQLGNASQNAVNIVNVELKKHYNDYEGSYLTKRCIENDRFSTGTGICSIIRAFIDLGNGNGDILISKVDSKDIIDYINPKSDKQVRADCCRKNNKPLTKRKEGKIKQEQKPKFIESTVAEMLEALAKNETPANIEQDDAKSKSINKTKKESKSKKIKVANMLELLAGNKPNPLTNFEIPKDLVGVSYEGLFAGKLEGSKSLKLVDTYILNNQQLENLAEFLSMYRKITPKIEQCEVHLLTKKPIGNQIVKRKHEMHLQQIKKKCADRGLKFTFEFNDDIHARSIKADNGCKISLDLGLDIFQKSEYINGDGYLKPQKERLCKKFDLVFLRW